MQNFIQQNSPLNPGSYYGHSHNNDKITWRSPCNCPILSAAYIFSSLTKTVSPLSTQLLNRPLAPTARHSGPMLRCCCLWPVLAKLCITQFWADPSYFLLSAV